MNLPGLLMFVGHYHTPSLMGIPFSTNQYNGMGGWGILNGSVGFVAI
jgi:hypothetical protein